MHKTTKAAVAVVLAAVAFAPTAVAAEPKSQSAPTCQARGLAGVPVFSSPVVAGRALAGYLDESSDTKLTIDAVVGEIDRQTGVRLDNRYFYRVLPTKSVKYTDYWTGTVQRLASPVWIPVNSLRSDSKWTACEPSLSGLPAGTA